jgi:hypothetical protein
MSLSARASALFVVGTVCLLSAPRVRAQLTGELYDLREGSTILDDCLACDRVPVERPISGSFLLTQVESFVCCIYTITDLSFTDPSGDYVIEGGGMYGVNMIGEVSQQMSLSLKVNGIDKVELQSGQVKITAPFPAMEITVTEDGQRDVLHKYTITLVASPHAPKVLYELVEGKEGSYFLDSCTICLQPEVLIPVAGTFRLTEIGPGPDSSTLYVVNFLDLHSTLDGFDYRITGSGSYERGGVGSPLQLMNLGVQVNDDPDVILDSGRVAAPEGVVFPDVTIDLAHQNPRSELHVYFLHLAAHPSKENLRTFRRGDSNGDAATDIADAVHILLWRFSGGAAPACLDAADTNADGLQDLTDAVFLLQYLFQGGAAPPRPGPQTCGFPEKPVFGCEGSPCG